MEQRQLLGDYEFRDTDANAQPILVDKDVRILRWMLEPGQVIGDHAVPDSPFYIVVLQGRGVFTGDGSEGEYGPGSLLLFAQGEMHSVRALDEALVFVSFMHGSDFMRPDHTGGEIGRSAR